MSHSLIPFSRIGKGRVEAEKGEKAREREKEWRRKLHSSFMIFFLIMWKSMKLIVSFLDVNVSPSTNRQRKVTSATSNAIKNSFNCSEGKLENFHLENEKISKFFFLSQKNTPPVRWETDHSKSSSQTGRCWSSLSVALGKVLWKCFLFVAQAQKVFPDFLEKCCVKRAVDCFWSFSVKR